MSDLAPLDVLEFLDHSRGRSAVAALERRGVPTDLIVRLADQGFVEHQAGVVQLTDAGAAMLSDPAGLEEAMAIAELDDAISEVSPAEPERSTEVVTEPTEPSTEVVTADSPADTEPEPPEKPAAEPEEDEMMVDELRQRQAANRNGGKTRERVLALLAEHPDGLRPKKVAELLGLKDQTAGEALRALKRSGDAEAVPLGPSTRAGTLYFVAGEAKVPPAPDLKATTSKPRRARKSPGKAVARRPKRAAAVAGDQEKPPPSDLARLERYLGVLGRLVSIEPPADEVLERLEAMAELDARVRSRGPETSG